MEKQTALQLLRQDSEDRQLSLKLSIKRRDLCIEFLYGALVVLGCEGDDNDKIDADDEIPEDPVLEILSGRYDDKLSKGWTPEFLSELVDNLALNLCARTK